MVTGTDQTFNPKAETVASDSSSLANTGLPGAEPDRGETIGRYLVLSRLGAGAMGVVLAAYDPELDRKVALKLLKPRGGDRRAAQTRLQREAQALAKLSHANVVGVHDVGLHEHGVFVAMEYVEGQTVGDWLAAGPHPWKVVLEIFLQAGRGLAAAHAAGLVHRDFKPDNIMLDNSGAVRVMDFGLARSDDQDDQGDKDALVRATKAVPDLDKLSTRLTQTGAIMGTPMYMSPEQFLGGEVDARSDQFGFCAALYKSLYSEQPFAGETLSALSASVRRGQIQDPPRGATVPGWVRVALLRGLSPEREDRWPSMDELLADLERGEARGRRRNAFIGGGVVVLGLAGVVAYDRYDVDQRTKACRADGDVVDEVWNEDSREALRAGLMATGVSYAATVAEHVMPWIDGQAEALREARTSACMNASVHESWNPKRLDKANWCLDERQLQFSTLVTQMANADASALQRAVQAASSLTQVEPCLDEKSLAVTPEPPGTDLRPEIEAVRGQLARASYLASAGAFGEGLLGVE
jgi:serine/threonine protein kinase